VVAPPHEQARHIKTVIGMQMRQKHLHGCGIGIALERA
jgi:hypothetical protein